MADAPMSNGDKKRHVFYDRARALGVVGGLAGIAVAAWTAIDESGGPLGTIGFLEREVSLSLMAMAWALIGFLGAIMRWPSAWVPGLTMVAGGAIGYVLLPDRFLIPGALLVIGGGATVVTGILNVQDDRMKDHSKGGRS